MLGDSQHPPSMGSHVLQLLVRKISQDDFQSFTGILLIEIYFHSKGGYDVGGGGGRSYIHT